MPRSINPVVFGCGLLALIAAVGGCQRGPTWGLASVEGTVTKGGRPVTGIQIEFRADVESGTQGPRASGITDPAGHYELRTDTCGRGAVSGRYHVCLVDPERMERSRDRNRTRQVKLPKEARMIEPPVADTVRLPPAYSRFQETPLRAEVQPGPQVIDFNLP